MFDRIEKGLFWDRALTLIEGCTPVSPGCDNCWSSAREHRFLQSNKDLTTNKKFNGRIICREDRLDLPLRVKKPQVWAVWNDLFHEGVPLNFIDRAIFNVTKANQHIFFVITKRPERALAWMQSFPERADMLADAKNVWLIVTAENQEQADKRIPILLQIPAAVRGVIAEPLLSNIDLTRVVCGNVPINTLRGSVLLFPKQKIDWVICGGESGPNARPAHPDWFRKLRDDCVAEGTPFFLKSLGEFVDEHHPNYDDSKRIDSSFVEMEYGEMTGPIDYHGVFMARVGKKAAGRLLDGQEWLQLQEVTP